METGKPPGIDHTDGCDWLESVRGSIPPKSVRSVLSVVRLFGVTPHSGTGFNLNKTLAPRGTMAAMVDDTLTIESLAGPADSQHILRLKGPIVLTTIYEFQRIVREDSSSTLILDFNDVPYIDSAGIGALTMGYVHRQKDKRGILLVGVNSRIRTALQVTKVDQFFQFADQIPGA